MSLSVVSITLNIRNNRTYPQRINVLGSPINPLDTANALTEYRWDITSYAPSASDTLILEYKPVGASVFSTFTYQISNANADSLVAALNMLGIGYFNYYTELGQNYLSTNNDDYVFGTLTINNNVPPTPTTSTTTTTTTAAPTSTTTSTTSTTTTCPVGTYFLITLPQVDCTAACLAGLDLSVESTTPTLGLGTFLYVVGSCLLTPISAGYYSDGTNCYQVDSLGEIIASSLCVIPTTTTTSTTTTTTTAAPTTTSTTSTTTTAAPTTTTSTTTTTTTAAPPTTTSTTSTTTTAAPTTTTSTTTTTTTAASTTTSTTTTTTTLANFSDTIGFGGAPEDACGFLASGSVVGDAPTFCACTTLTGSIFSAAATGTWYVSFGGQYVSVSVTNGNPVATVTSSCTTCPTPTTTSTTTTTTTAASTTSTTTTTTTALITCSEWTNLSGIDAFYDWTDCDGTIHLNQAIPNNISICAQDGTVSPISGGTLTLGASCTITPTTTTSTTTSTTTLFTNLVFDLTTGIGGYTIGAIDVNSVTPTLTGGTNVPFSTDTHTFNTDQVGTNETLNIFVSAYSLNGCITVTDSASNVFQANINATGTYSFVGITIDNITAVQVVCADNVC